MSADNYYVIVPHPDGRGFAAVMGFASDGEVDIQATDRHKSFSDILDAIKYATDEMPEYGVSVSDAAYDLKEKLFWEYHYNNQR